MADGVDFGLLKTPDYVGDYANAFKVGRQMAGPPATIAAPNAFATGSLGAMSAQARAQAAQRAELLGAVGMGLAGAPYGERRAILAHMTPALAARGVDPAQIAAFDPTDANIETAVARARSLAGQLSASPAV